MKYQLNLEGFETLRQNDKYKVNVKTGVILGPSNNILNTKSRCHTYHAVSIGSCHFYLSRLIWEHANGDIVGKFDVDHIDNNPENNLIDNQKLIAHQDNVKKTVKTKIIVSPRTI